MARLNCTFAAISKHGLLAISLSMLACANPQAADISVSGFGTLGVAISDQEFRYQRSITSDGTLERDSVLGAQMDAQFSPQWSGTVQAKVAPSVRRDSQWDLTASWAFISWRPSNEWLVRAGKLRTPLYLFSENLDVGQSYDLVRMPTETYSIAPTTDIVGLYVTRNWELPASELSLDVVVGRAGVHQRLYSRDGGAEYKHVTARAVGTVLSWRTDELTLRAGWLRAFSRLEFDDLPPKRLQYVSMGPGAGAYLPDGSTDKITNDLISLGMDWRLSDQWRVLAEYERGIQHDTALGVNTYGGHVAVLKTMDRWTPYVTVAALKSTSASRKLRKALNAVQVPAGQPFSEALVGSQRLMADFIPFYDQYSLALGTSYALTPQSKVKAELMHTQVREGSALVDSPPGRQPLKNEGINVLSLSYSFVF